jgi:hypothetical protein
MTLDEVFGTHRREVLRNSGHPPRARGTQAASLIGSLHGSRGLPSTDKREHVSPWLCRSTAERWTTLGGASKPGPAVPTGAGDGKATQTFVSRDPVTEPRPAGPANPPLGAPAEIMPPHSRTEAMPSRPRTQVVPPRPPTEIMRYGPGVPVTAPAGEAGITAERVSRTGHPPTSPRRPPRLRRLFGSALTVILLAASGVVLYQRLHHAPFHVTGVSISQQTRTRCGVDVTGRIATNGSAGTVSYQWLFQPGQQPPQPLTQSVTAGQQAVYVTVAVEGSGHGRTSQTVTLQVLGPDPGHASTAAVVRC